MIKTIFDRIADGIITKPTILDEAFALIKQQCQTPEGIQEYMTGTNWPQFTKILEILTHSSNAEQKALSFKILTTKGVFYKLMEEGPDEDQENDAFISLYLESDLYTKTETAEILLTEKTLLSLAEFEYAEKAVEFITGDIFTTEQKVEILSHDHETLSKLAQYKEHENEIAKIMDLITGDIFTTEQKVKILSGDKIVCALTDQSYTTWETRDQSNARKIIDLLKSGIFTSEQITQILTAQGSISGLSMYYQADEVMELLTGETLTPEQITDILSVDNNIYELVDNGQAETIMTLLESKRLAPEQIKRILNAKNAVDELKRAGLEKRIHALQIQIDSNSAPTPTDP